jgi:C1A family cysteine protease
VPRKIKGYGWIPDLPDHRDHLYAAPPPRLTALPPSTDLRPQCPPVYDQGQLGSCTANAIAGAIEFDQMKQGQTPFVPSRLFIYYNERDIEGTVGSDSGAQIRDGIKSVAQQGVCPEPEWPYDITKFTEKPPDTC